MPAHLKPYPAYKESATEWLGEVPEHWCVIRLKNLATIRNSNVDKHTREAEIAVHLCNYVDVYKNDYIRSNTDFMSASATQQEIEDFQLHPGDVIVTKDSEAWDDIGVPALIKTTKKNLICGYHLALIRPNTKRICSDFLFRALQSCVVAIQFHVRANGVTRYGLSLHTIHSVRLPVPLLPEQVAISNYLERETDSIDQLIRANKTRIELLNELKQATIHKAIVGQNNISTGKPYPRYKDTGVEWLSEVPINWRVVRLTVCCDNVSEASKDENDNEKSVLALEHVESWTGRILSTASSSEFDSKLKRFQRGDILFGKLRPYLAKVVRPQTEGLCVSEFLVIRTKSEHCSAHFLEYLLRSKPFIGLVDSSTFGAKMPRAEWQFIGGITIALPPIPEQIMITSFLDKITANIDSLIHKTHGLIKLVQEYRNCLIEDIVTGKFDVRDAVQARSIQKSDSSSTNVSPVCNN